MFNESLNEMNKIYAFIATLSCMMPCLAANAQSYVPKDGEIGFSLFQTTKDKPFRSVLSTPFTPHRYSDVGFLDLDSASDSHPFWGIGISITDASCWLLSQMSAEDRHAFLERVFGRDGMNLGIIRLNCGSSDYATELYNYNDHSGDVSMRHFSIERDRKYMIPIIKEIQQIRPDVFIFSSIWSAPGWMKTSGQMCGGSLKDEYLQAFANYWAAYLKAYKEEGVVIDAMTVQNEPLTDQAGGCPATLVSAEQEARLVGKLLPAAFRKAGLGTKIWLLDHNFLFWERVIDELSDEDVLRNVAAVAWHPYEGSPSVQEKVHERFPGMEMHLTEHGPAVGDHGRTAKWWSEEICACLNYGCSSYTGWNLLLDTDGQPVTGKFNCAGLYSIDTDTGAVLPSSQLTVFSHIAPFVKPGAVILRASHPDKELPSMAFRNPDGSIVVFIASDNLHRRKKFQIKYRGNFLSVALPMETWSLTTVVIRDRS